MRYGELIRFEPIETVIKLKDANRQERAEALVESYVMSDQMAEKLERVVIHNLQFDEPADQKALMIVGNYGSGKSHLMSLITAVAESEAMLSRVRNARFREAARAIAGRFIVVRAEIGSSEMPLRDIVLSELEHKLEELGVPYRFPDPTTVPNYKAAFTEMMDAFHRRYPDHGLLFALDELLDHLKRLNNQQLFGALAFLREVGEVIGDLRFRFIAGVQEAIFDSGRFAHEADALRRVKDRFEQLTIDKADLKFIVSERLLAKTEEQRQKIREHLLRFTPFYERMHAELDEYVRLFPFHPDYIDTIARVKYVENREVLRTFSNQMRDLLERDVPADAPGLISYDSYWEIAIGDRSLRSFEDVREVVDTVEELLERIQRGMGVKRYVPLAVRIIKGLGIQALTRTDIRLPIGPTTAELRDTLALFDPEIAEFGGEPLDDLATHIETVMREVIRTVNGQYLSRNKENGQWYIDVRKKEDFDAKIEARMEALSPDDLNAAYHDVLKRLLEVSDYTAYVPQMPIWAYEVPWLERNVTRYGYLFFGTPNERSTAVPPRDFYLYFIHPFDPPPFKDEKRPDEIFFRLTPMEESWFQALKRYAAAVDLAKVSSGQAKSVYQEKADEQLKALNVWMRDHFQSHFQVTYQGKTKTLDEWVGDLEFRRHAGLSSLERISFREYINIAAGHLLSRHFEEQAPEYPRFASRLTRDNHPKHIEEALFYLAGLRRSKAGKDVLEALELLVPGPSGSGTVIDVQASRYARVILEKLEQKGPNKALNRQELLEAGEDGEEYLEKRRFRLELDFVLVVLAALVYSGHIVLHGKSRSYGPTDMKNLAQTPLPELRAFRFIAPQRDWPYEALAALMDLFELPPGTVQELTQLNAQVVRELHREISRKLELLARAQERLRRFPVFWGRPPLPATVVAAWGKGLEETRAFLDRLISYDAPGKFKQFAFDAEEIRRHRETWQIVAEIEQIYSFLNDVQGEAAYLEQAALILPLDHPWQEQFAASKQAILSALAEEDRGIRDEAVRQQIRQNLKGLKEAYIRAYQEAHQRARLDPAQRRRKESLHADDRLAQLKALRAIPVLPHDGLDQWDRKLSRLKSCERLLPQDLEKQPKCPRCGYEPSREPASPSVGAILESLERELDFMYEQWLGVLRQELDKPEVRLRIELLRPEEQHLLASFVEAGKVPARDFAPWLEAVKTALSTLERLTISEASLIQALKADGIPLKVEELEARFRRWLDGLIAGKDRNLVRLVFERGEAADLPITRAQKERETEGARG